MSVIQPRVIRLRDAAAYLGMDKNRFNSEVRPFVTEIPIGSQGVGFDRLDLDQWLEDYKRCNGRRADEKGEKKPWRKRKSQGSSSVKACGTSKNDGGAAEFERAVERVTSMRRKDT